MFKHILVTALVLASVSSVYGRENKKRNNRDRVTPTNNSKECNMRQEKRGLRMCRNNKQALKDDLNQINRIIEELSRDQNEMQREYQACLRNKSRVQDKANELNSNIRQVNRTNQRIKDQIESHKRELRYAKNYPKKWKCFVVLRKGRGRYEAVAKSPAAGIMKVLDKCTAVRGKNCGDGNWSPNSTNRWGCTPAS